MINYHNRRFLINEPLIDTICGRFSLTEYQIEEVKRLYYKALQKYLTQGRKFELCIGALIYYIKKRDKEPITMKTIGTTLNEDVKLLFKSYKKMRKEMRLMFRR